MVIGSIALAGVGVYIVFKNASDTSAVEEEAKNLNNAIGRVQNALTTQGSSVETSVDAPAPSGGKDSC